MEIKMKDKTKKALFIGGLIVVVVGLTVGVKSSLKVPDSPEVPSVVQTTEAPEVNVNDIKPVTPQVTGLSSEEEETEKKEVMENTETAENAVPVSAMPKQEIQETPKKTEDEKPVEPPIENQAEKEPETAKETETTGGNSSSPKDGEIKDGNIYFEGFGWIPYEGGGAEGISDGEMYENGNKIGVMD